MAKRDRYHVTKKDGDWWVKKEGAERASGRHDTQSQAIEQGRKLASQEKGQLLIHKANGRIREERTYGRDPFPPKG